MLVNIVMLDRSDVKKTGVACRALSFFISLCAAVGLAGVAAFGFEDGITPDILFVASVPLLLLYVCLPIFLSGYPPKALLWMSDKDQ